MGYLLRRAVEIYRHEGLFSLLESASNFILNLVHWNRRHKAPDNTLDVYRRQGVLGTVRSFVDHLLSLLVLAISLDRESLVQVARQEHANWWLPEEQTFTVDPPKGGEVPNSLEEVLGEWTMSRSFLCEIKDATILGPRGILLTDGRPILEAFVNSPVSFLYHLRGTLFEIGRFETLASTIGTLFGFEPDTTTHEFDVAVSLITRHPTETGKETASYSHWIQEDLTKLWAIEKYRERTGRNPVLLLNSDPPSWMIETLQLLGYDESDWIEWDGERGKIDRLVVPRSTPTGSFSQEPSPKRQQWLRDTVLSNIDTDELPEFSKYVYKSRQGAPRRRVANYDEVMDMLSEYGFESYRAEELSIAENVKLCSEAEVIISPVGTGLTDMLYSDDPTIIELFMNDWAPPFNFVHANIYGFDYYSYVGDAVDVSSVDYENEHLVTDDSEYLKDIYIDVDELQRILKSDIGLKPQIDS